MDKSYWIKSKPQYGTLQWKTHGIAHRLIASGEGGLALVKLFQLRYPQQPLKVFYIDDSIESNSKYTEILQQLVTDDLMIFSNQAEARAAIESDLEQCYMGTQFYVAGDEVFIWDVLKALTVYGIQDNNVAKELCGSLVRAVYCVHCKTINKAVHHNVHQCVGCQRHLLVRDHFSRKLGAYMGFMIDAEEPGNLPEIQEIYP